MAPDEPTPLSQVPPVSGAALDFAKTQFRYKSGRGMVYAGLAVLFASNFEPLLVYFTPEFPARAIKVTWVLLAFGVALTGPEVADAFERVVGSIRKVVKS